MNFKQVGIFGAKTLAVSLVMLITVILVTSLVPNGMGEADTDGAGITLILLLIVTTVDALIIGSVVKGSPWNG